MLGVAALCVYPASSLSNRSIRVCFFSLARVFIEPLLSAPYLVAFPFETSAPPSRGNN